jgi:hypothetical protein
LTGQFEVPSAFKRNTSKQPHLISGGIAGGIPLKGTKTYPDMVDEAVLRLLTSKVAEMRKEIVEIQTAGLSVTHR